MARARTLSEVKAEYLDTSSEAKRLWDETSERRTLGLTLAELRVKKGLTQAELAEAAGWDKGYVSRLEGATGGFPDIKTLARYAAACDERIAIVISDQLVPVSPDNSVPLDDEDGEMSEDQPSDESAVVAVTPQYYENG